MLKRDEFSDFSDDTDAESEKEKKTKTSKSGTPGKNNAIETDSDCNDDEEEEDEGIGLFSKEINKHGSKDSEETSQQGKTSLDKKRTSFYVW